MRLLLDTNSDSGRQLFTPTGEPFFGTLPADLRLLGLLGLVRVCTVGQAARYAFGGDAERAHRELEDLRARRLIARINRLDLPKDCGAPRRARPYYLRESALKVLNGVDEGLAGRAVYGRPASYEMKSLPRLLGVTESYLWWMTRGYAVLDFRQNLRPNTPAPSGRGRRG